MSLSRVCDSGMTYQEILDDFPYLSQQDILGCLSFAAKR
ncbi:MULTISPECIES: DUF433 domain-containing protein [unclassified Microcoleus]